jgi:iron(III) transport system substrate-binding protein
LRLLLILIFSFVLAACSGDDSPQNDASADEITVYSSRAEYLIKPLFDQFTVETGIRVRYTTDSEAALISRLEAEGENTPADMLLTVDAGNLWHADSLGLFQPVDSEILRRSIPANLKAENNHWFGLSVRARTIVYSTKRVDPSELSTYEGLADEKWRGRLCLRTSRKVYNQSLVASMIARLGAEQTENVVRGWVANLAVDPLNSDTTAIEAVLAGACDVTLVNTYYFGRMEADDPNIEAAIFWPNQQSSGVHVNVSGAGVTRYAPNPDGAIQLIEWLSQSQAQHLFEGLNREFPANPEIEAVPEVQAWGAFKADDLSVEVMGSMQAQSIMLMDRAGYR